MKATNKGIVRKRTAWKGGSRLVISIDIGTTCSAASYCILEKDKVPNFIQILSWPKQPATDSKVPSILYYDEWGQLSAIGADCEDENTLVTAEENGWRRVEWWKLHLRPPHLPIIRNLDLPALPPAVTVDRLFVDFFRYINSQIKKSIVESLAGGGKKWIDLSPGMHVVLTTPNGWEGRQQNRMRQAAIEAGLVSVDGGRRVSFVTESEAAVLYASSIGNIDEWLQINTDIIVCDCGGGTIDITGYTITATKPLRLKESVASSCYLNGGMFVAKELEKFLQGLLKDAKYDTDDGISETVQHFEKNAKKTFENIDSHTWLPLRIAGANGQTIDIPELFIRQGRIKIAGTDMARFFNPTIDTIIQGLETALENGDWIANKVVLVGGLANSPYVYSRLLKWGKERDIAISRPDGPTVKAVADGALHWHLDCAVFSRVARYHYGTDVDLPFNSRDKEVKGREWFADYRGVQRIKDGWGCILKKDISIIAKKEFTGEYCQQLEEEATDFTHSSNVYVYRRESPPKYLKFPGSDKLYPGFELLCQVEGDLRRCFESSPTEISSEGKKFREVQYQVCLKLGDTEITAHLA